MIVSAGSLVAVGKPHLECNRNVAANDADFGQPKKARAIGFLARVLGRNVFKRLTERDRSFSESNLTGSGSCSRTRLSLPKSGREASLWKGT